MNKKIISEKKSDWENKADKLKLKYNRNQDGYKKHKKRDYKSW
jgi:hypothetical protein